jgi:hypothetical protein
VVGTYSWTSALNGGSKRHLIVPSFFAVAGLGAGFMLFRSGTPVQPSTALDPGKPPASVSVTERAHIRVVTLTDRPVQPWALALLPDGDITDHGTWTAQST